MKNGGVSMATGYNSPRMAIHSPFPGMDPWLEQYWLDIHPALITYSRDLLQARLPSGLRARMQEWLLVEEEDGKPRSIYPDVALIEHPGARGGDATSAVAVAEPVFVRLDEPRKQTRIEILDMSTGGKAITLIEILSPSNKFHGPGRVLYQRKQREVMEAGVSLVEIDLLRDGNWTMLAPFHKVPAQRRATYNASVFRSWKWNQLEIYPLPMRQPLPAIPVPLRPTDEDAKLELQTLIEMAYRNGGYDTIDYTKPPYPPLHSDEAAWAAEVLKNRSAP